jgi:hypothetical protein
MYEGEEVEEEFWTFTILIYYTLNNLSRGVFIGVFDKNDTSDMSDMTRRGVCPPLCRRVCHGKNG